MMALPFHPSNAFLISRFKADPEDYDRIEQGDVLEVNGLLDQMKTREIEVCDVTKGFAFKTRLELSDSGLEVISCGGQLRYLQKQLAEADKEREEKQ